MNTYRTLLTGTLPDHLTPSLTQLGLETMRGLKWRRDDLEVRVVVDSKAVDPFRGGAFTLEFEKSSDRRFEVKLAGRTRVNQLLDSAQELDFLAATNVIASRLPRPPAGYVEALPLSLRTEYLRPFDPVTQLDRRFWMRFREARDLATWCQLLSAVMPSLVQRADSVDPHQLILGQRLKW